MVLISQLPARDIHKYRVVTNNSNETYTCMCLGRAGRFGQGGPFWAELKLL